MQDANLSPLRRFRSWLNNNPAREKFYPVLIVMATYLFAVVGGILIGMTSYGIFITGGLGAAAVGLIIGLRPHLGMYVLIFFIFTNMSDVLEVAFGIPDSNKLLVGLLLVGTLASRVVIDNKPIIFRITEISVLATGMVMILSLLVGVDQSEMGAILVDWGKDFVILFVIIQLSSEEKIWKNTHWALITAAAFLAFFSVYHTISGDTTNDFYGLAKAPVHEITEGFDSTRITGPLDDPNYYAMTQLMTLPTAIYMTLTAQKTSTRILAGTMMMMIMATILFTFSRGAFVSMIIVCVLIIRERKMNPYRIALTIIIVTAILWPFMPAGFTDRLNTLSGVVPSGDAKMQTESSFRGRTSELLVAIMMFGDHPILGVGKKNYATSYLDYSSRLGLDDRLEDRQAHSLYFEYLAEQGIVGTMSFGIMILLLYLGMQRAKDQFRRINREDLVPRVNGIQYGLLGYLLASVFLHADYERYLWLIIGFSAACSVVAEQMIEKHNREYYLASFDSSMSTKKSSSPLKKLI